MNPSRLFSCFRAVAGPLSVAFAVAAPAAHPDQDVTALGIEDLMNLDVVSTAKQSQRLSDAAAAVFVITREDIRRSGATSIPELLRMAPGVQVARIDANKWAVTARGFNGRFANKLLVLIDGRSVYTPAFSGVYWEVHDLPLADIERIEVIRGPGASLWGANAVNGIINIITKHSLDTQGNLLSLTAGDEERWIATLRHGGEVGQFGHYRVYGKLTRRDALVDLEGEDADDDWHIGRLGFRLDWAPSVTDTFTLHGDVYQGELDQNLVLPDLSRPPGFRVRVQDTADVSGAAIQGRWERIQSQDSELSLQMFYQVYRREERFASETRHTLDVEFQHDLNPSRHQNLVWGLGYRHSTDRIDGSFWTSVTPEEEELNLFNAFVQDRIDLSDTLELTLGAKLEHNDYTGWEWQPSVRALWAPRDNQRVWAAVSRAVRTPSRGDRDSNVNAAVRPPGFGSPLPWLLTIEGNEDYDSETLWAYELGYRVWPSDNLSLDITAFYHDYEQLRTLDLTGTPVLETGPAGPYLNQTVTLQNNAQGNAHGVELAMHWRPAQDWRLELAYSYLDLDQNTEREGFEITREANLAPRHQVSLRSQWQPWERLEVDGWLRYVDMPDAADERDIGGLDDYLTLDLRLGWQARPDLELSLVGKNLLDTPRLEFLNETFAFPTRVERSVYGQIKWSF